MAFLIGDNIDRKSSTSRKKLHRQRIDLISSVNNILIIIDFNALHFGTV